MSLRPTFLSCVIAAVAGLACSCGSGTAANNGTSGGGGGGIITTGGGVPVKLPDGSTVPAVACGDENVSSASGTWDVVTTGSSDSVSATIVIDASNFSFSSSGQTLAFSTSGSSMTLDWHDKAKPVVPIAVTHTSDALGTGVLPLGIGGQWSFRGQTKESCTSSLSASAFLATCTDLRSTPVSGIDGSVTGMRQQQLGSIFGDLGGVWHLTGSGSKTSVDVTISGNVFTAVINSSTAGNSDWLTMKICTGTATGKVSGGAEIAATRH